MKIRTKCFLQFGKPPLLVACEGGYTETAKLLIDRGANVNPLLVGVT